MAANARTVSIVIAYLSGVLEGIYESEDDAKEFCRLHPRCEYRTGAVTSASSDKCEGESCWFNQETGYREYCPKHEAIIADKAMEHTAGRLAYDIYCRHLKEYHNETVGGVKCAFELLEQRYQDAWNAAARGNGDR